VDVFTCEVSVVEVLVDDVEVDNNVLDCGFDVGFGLTVRLDPGGVAVGAISAALNLCFIELRIG